METQAKPTRLLWLVSRRADFWLASGGASVGLLAGLLLLILHGDHELDGLDFVLSEFHLGATYDAVIRRRLWDKRQVEVLFIPLAILALTYALSMNGQAIWLTSIAMYAAVWHRGRQSLGVARFYRRQVGPVSRAHDVLFRGAIYLPMLAALLAYTHLEPTEYDGQTYIALSLGAGMTCIVGVITTLWVITYLSWTLRPDSSAPFINAMQNAGIGFHPGERWVVLAHALAFGSGYAFGASNASFLLVLAVHHEVQYLYFAYAMARRPTLFCAVTGIELGKKDVGARAWYDAVRISRPELKFAATFLVWPIAGFVGALVGAWLQLGWLAPMGIGGLFCHYWLDGRIWRPSFRN